MSNEPEPQSDLFQDTKHVRQDAMYLKMALRRRWPIKNRKAIMQRLMAIIEKKSVKVATRGGIIECDSAADRNALAAIEALLAMEDQNQKDDHKVMPDLSMNINANVNQSLPKPQDADPDYIEFLRQRAIQVNSNAGTVCPDSQPRALEDVPTPRND